MERTQNWLAGAKSLLPFLGPAFVASIAYMDPGNFATNIAAGSQFGYALLWVVLWSSLMAILVQYLSAKLGIATGRNLPQLCRERFSPQVSAVLWVIAEIIAIATDMAEFLGAALGFYLLFGMPLPLAAAITGVLVFVILAIEKYGFRKLELAMMGFVAAIMAAYFFEIFIAKPDWGKIAFHTAVPMIGPDSVFLAVGILGATIMPHVIYLHSELVQHRVRQEHAKGKHLAHTRSDILIALNLAFLVNAAMVIMAAAVFYSSGKPIGGMEDAHDTLHPLLGSAASAAFAFALLCAGLSSATVGTMAGQVVMEGFMKRSIPIFLRRLLTMLPALAVIALGFDPLQLLIFSQVVLSFGIPFALIPLVIFTSDRKLMGEQVNQGKTTLAAWGIAALIIALNLVLVLQALGVK